MAHGVVKQHHLRDIPHIEYWVNVGLPVCTSCNKTWLYTTFQNHDIVFCYVGLHPSNTTGLYCLTHGTVPQCDRDTLPLLIGDYPRGMEQNSGEQSFPMGTVHV